MASRVFREESVFREDRLFPEGVGVGAVKKDALLQWRQFAKQRFDSGTAPLVAKQYFGLGIGQEVREFTRRIPGVERQADGLQAHGCQVKIDKGQALGQLQRHAVAWRNPLSLQHGHCL